MNKRKPAPDMATITEHETEIILRARYRLSRPLYPGTWEAPDHRKIVRLEINGEPIVTLDDLLGAVSDVIYGIKDHEAELLTARIKRLEAENAALRGQIAALEGAGE